MEMMILLCTARHYYRSRVQSKLNIDII